MAARHMSSTRVTTARLANMLLLLTAVAVPAVQARMAIACSPFVYPCHCGLCPYIVNCKAKLSAECFCGTAAPGSYPHPKDNTKFWMCSHDSRALVRYGVEVACPARLVFDPIVKVCTLPTTAAQSAAAASSATPSPIQLAGNQGTATQAWKKAVSRATAVERAQVAYKP